MWSINVPICKNYGTDVQNFGFKNFDEFLKCIIWLLGWLVGSSNMA